MRNKKELIKEYLIVVLGNFILAAGVVFFVIPNEVLTGGVAGIAIALFPVVHIPTEFMINALTILLFLIGVVFLGKQFALKTLLSSICYPFFISFLTHYANTITITNNQLLASIYGGLFMGIGVGIVFRTGASTGGMDIPPLIINKITKWHLPTLVLITDACTVLLGAMVYGVEPALIGVISVWLSSYAIDKTMMLGGMATKNVMIISNHREEILQVIYHALGRGATLIEAKGSYSNENRPIIMVCIAKKQYPLLSKEIMEIDPKAFVIVTDANEVQGYGFSYLEKI